MNRRALVTTALMLPIGYVVSGMSTCGGGTSVTSTTISDALKGIQALGTEASAIYQQLVAGGMKVSSATASTVQTILNGIQSAASSLTAANAATLGQSILAQVEGYINALAPLVAPFVTGGGSTILQIALMALPAIETGFNMLVSLLTPAAKALVPAPTPTAAAVTPAQALQQLIGLAEGGAH
jgi:hypothetical protein